MVNIIGNGQIAQEFKSKEKLDDAIIFASGVADSNSLDEKFFDRERTLIEVNVELSKTSNKVFVYFSSCALSSNDYELSRYYKHKKEMEDIIKKMTDRYLILRLPQLFGEIKRHPTLINYLYYNIMEHKNFMVYRGAYRYVICVSDLYLIVRELLLQGVEKQTLDIANTYRYSILDIVNIMEELTGVKALYDVIEKEDGYILDLDEMIQKIDLNKLDISFNEKYLYNRLSTKIKGIK